VTRSSRADDGIELDDRPGTIRRRTGLERKDQIMDKAKGLAALRIVLGVGFLYAGLEKVLDFTGSGKPFSAAGFLAHGTAGTLPGSAADAVVNPTNGFWVGLAANTAIVDMFNTLVVFGEVAIGIALILGFATRFAGIMGALLMGLISIAAWNFGFGPINETVLYAAVALYLAYAEAGLAYGVDAYLEKTEIVAHRPALHYLLG
jgi:thiosulfate dehydrogenase [quinone] large subunit